MRVRRLAARFAAVAVLFGLDSALAHFAVERNVAGALLSPAGPMPLDAWSMAMGLLAARVGWIVLLVWGAGALVSDIVGRYQSR